MVYISSHCKWPWDISTPTALNINNCSAGYQVAVEAAHVVSPSITRPHRRLSHWINQFMVMDKSIAALNGSVSQGNTAPTSRCGLPCWSPGSMGDWLEYEIQEYLCHSQFVPAVQRLAVPAHPSGAVWICAGILGRSSTPPPHPTGAFLQEIQTLVLIYCGAAQDVARTLPEQKRTRSPRVGLDVPTGMDTHRRCWSMAHPAGPSG